MDTCDATIEHAGVRTRRGVARPVLPLSGLLLALLLIL